MKKDKITKNIMNKVIKYEKSHTYQAIEIWLVVILGISSLLILVLVDLITEMNESGATDLISMVTGDWELAKEFGSVLWDTLVYDLPWFKICEALFLTFLIGIFIYLFSKRLVETKKKWAQMKKYFDDMEK
jgi:hypothetical protein